MWRLTSLDLPPFSEMPCDNFFDVIGDMYPTHVDCAVLSHKASYTSHIVSVVAVLVPPKYIHVRIKHIMYSW